VVTVTRGSHTVVDVAAAREATIDEVLSSGVGEIVARRSAMLRSPLQAPTLFEVLVEPGARVSAGDVVARAADPVIDGARAALETRLAAAEERSGELRAAGNVDNARSLERGEIARLKAQLASTTGEAKDRQIRVPFDGVIVDVLARVGELV